MATLSSDTGGKAFFDSNDFSPAFQRIQQDTSAYYVIGFRSTDTLRDGRYRRLTIKINRPGVKLEYRPGYYAPADYQHANKDERERQLQEQLASDLACHRRRGLPAGLLLPQRQRVPERRAFTCLYL